MQSEHKNETEGNFTIKQCNENKNHRTVICTTNNYNANNHYKLIINCIIHKTKSYNRHFQQLHMQLLLQSITF